MHKGLLCEDTLYVIFVNGLQIHDPISISSTTDWLKHFC